MITNKKIGILAFILIIATGFLALDAGRRLRLFPKSDPRYRSRAGRLEITNEQIMQEMKDRQEAQMAVDEAQIKKDEAQMEADEAKKELEQAKVIAAENPSSVNNEQVAQAEAKLSFKQKLLAGAIAAAALAAAGYFHHAYSRNH